MRKTLVAVLALTIPTFGTPHAWADLWDLQIQNDDSVNTENELVHGSDQFHDLIAHGGPLAADLDFYRFRQERASSYEIVVDSASGDIGPGPGILTLVNSSGGTTVQTSEAVSPSIGYALSLRLQNAGPADISDQRILVKSLGCTLACNAQDVYRIRSFETTLALPRFNNSATQVTMVMLQNSATYPVQGNIWFWSATGTLLAQHPFSLPPRNLAVVNTSAIAGAAGAAGAATISHTARHGDLVGKAVSLEPATGYTFDTPLIPKVR
jgi:hypothetical protein